MASTRDRRPARIGDILKERICALGWESRLREEEVLTGWDAAVGPQIAAHARPSHISDRRLTLVTESPVWTQQLSLLKRDLLRRIAGTFGPDVVTDLFFVTGRIEPERPARPEATTPPPAPASLSAELESELAAIPDPEVRNSLRRLMLAAAGGGGPERADTDPA